MVVTATRSERSTADIPVSVTLVPQEVLEQSPTRTLDDALRTVVGLNLPLGNSNLIQPTTNNVSMRGLGGDRALVLLDGVPQNDAVAGYVHWNKMPLADDRAGRGRAGRGLEPLRQLRDGGRREHHHPPARAGPRDGRRLLRLLQHVAGQRVGDGQPRRRA